MSDWLKLAAWAVYSGGQLTTWVYLTFLDGYSYTWWNWPLALVANTFCGILWPVYWTVLRPVFGH